ncbi:putative crossover junction endonuclease MUS81 [Cryptosporidium felis]|nr:putative crossover junction endonuclease MUS81 [Cryptosporidium felis]
MESLKILNSVTVRKKRVAKTPEVGSEAGEDWKGKGAGGPAEPEDLLKNKKVRRDANYSDEDLLTKSQFLGKAHPFNLVYLEHLESMKRSTKTIQRLSMIKKAIHSIKQYPIPIISQQQFQILEGIGNYLGSQLEKLIRPDRLEKLAENKEYQQRCREYRDYKIGELNGLVDPILEQRPEADQSILEALENDPYQEDHQNKPNARTSGAGTPQIYGEKWTLIVIIALLEALKPNRDISLDRIQNLYAFLKEHFEPKITIRKAEKSIKQLVKQEILQVNTQHLKVQGFPIGSEKISYSLSPKGKKISRDCFKSVELIDFIISNSTKEQYKEIISQENVSDIIRSFDSRLKTKVFLDYEIVMIIDYREVNTFLGNNNGEDEHGVSNKSSGIPQHLLNRLRDQGIKIELKSLPIGDVMWIARPKLQDREETQIEDCFVLPWIIERKTGSDMCSSILDGRYEEQKYRLMRSLGAENVIYLLEDLNSIHENIVWSSSSGGPISGGRVAPKQVLRSAQASTQLIAGFHVLQSQSIGHTLTLLVGMHQMITDNVRKRYGNATGRGADDYLEAERDRDKERIEVITKISENRPTFRDWELQSKKTSNLTVEETFGKQLRSIKGCGPEATETLLEVWPTPYKMYEEMSGEASFEELYSKVLSKSEEIRRSRLGSGKKRLKPCISRDLLFGLYCLFSDKADSKEELPAQ